MLKTRPNLCSSLYEGARCFHQSEGTVTRETMAAEKKSKVEESGASKDLKLSSFGSDDFDSFWEEEIAAIKAQDLKDWDVVITEISSAVIRRLKLPDTAELREHLRFTMEADEAIRQVLIRELGL
jgi:hypothetical protein